MSETTTWSGSSRRRTLLAAVANLLLAAATFWLNLFLLLLVLLRHFRGGFAPIVEEEGGLILTADEPGLSTNRLEVFEALRTVPAALGPMWPVDDAAEYRAEQLAEELVAARL